MSGASTYAVGQVAKRHYETDGTLVDVDLNSAKKRYDEALERGKQVVGDLKKREAESKDVYTSLERLSDLKQKGVITDEEFEAKKGEMLERL